ncbi:hypothetical protein DFJ63DRAFT_322429 [Scheffersomyces coipomensis]|uniref:uncharacterized protein n=1 Tax=Scheffersomyces coipomensis TaxID=1788519 RepID=UPI00315E0075
MRVISILPFLLVLVSGSIENYEHPIDIIHNAVNELHSLDAATDLNECITCKTRLQIGKFLALTRPDLVPQIFTIWCLEAGNDETQCHMNYGYPSLEYSSIGNDFTKVVSLMDPEGLDGDLFCYYHDDKCHILPETPELDLSNLWPPKPKVYEAPQNSGETFNVLHISDINLQLNYKLLTEANCSQSVCCSEHSYNYFKPPESYDYSPIHNPSNGLSFYDSSYTHGHFEKGQYVDLYSNENSVWSPCHEFGSYTCETPLLLLNNTLHTIRNFHQNHLQFEMAIFTGGTVEHQDRIFIDKHHILKTQEVVYKLLKTYLPSIPIIGTFGIRDTFPINQLPPKNLIENSVSYQWEFDFLADLWLELDWIDLDASKQIRYSHTGFSIITSRGLKIISLNSNVWNDKNLYNFWNVHSIDKFGIWKFLIDELLESEVNEQRVWIISHLPPSSRSLPLPAKVLTLIIGRFSPKVIAAIFFGSNLKDSFNLIYGGDGCDSKELEKAINFALIGPSISPYSGVNPAWRYYAIDEKSFNIVNSFTYNIELNETFINGGAEPSWQFEYSARELYDPEGLWPMERSLDTEWWYHATEKIRDMPNMSELYSRLAYRSSPFTPLGDDLVDNDNYCIVTSFTVEARKQCMMTEDQDNYIAPAEPIDYFAYIKPYAPVEYVGYGGEEESAEPENSEIPNDEVAETTEEEVKPQVKPQKVLRGNGRSLSQKVQV